MKSNLYAACVVAVGLIIGSFCLYLGIEDFVNKDRIVSVKGLSTREVKADHVVWPLSFSADGNDLPALYAEIGKLQDIVKNFLLEKGFKIEDIAFGTVSVSDNWDSYYNHRPEFHYSISSKVVVSTDDVDLVAKANGSQAELLQRGIIVNSSEWSIDYEFRGLSELKPEMIQEATKNARAVAQKFADDADCSLGSISTASQGQFSVSDDPYQPWIKHVRVVTTVDYFLK